MPRSSAEGPVEGRSSRPRRPWWRGWKGAVVLFLLAGVCWVVWTESFPGAERELRLVLRDRLEEWFPEAMQPQPGWHGLAPVQHPEDARLTVVLVHGLDEPGGIWADLEKALRGEPLAVWKLRYPNDQAIERSAAFLAEEWSALPREQPVALVGHSMGGLVIREFVSAWRHPVGSPPRLTGAPVCGVILVGTPNHGSEWARLRLWLELRDHFNAPEEREFSLFAALRDGVGTAKLDLRPGSGFLRQLNARPWPETVERRLIAGALMDDEVFAGNLERLAVRAPDDVSAAALRQWWETAKGNLGDGVVTLDSVALEGAPPPEVLPASHRGLLRSGGEAAPAPAIAPILEWLDAWAGERRQLTEVD